MAADGAWNCDFEAPGSSSAVNSTVLGAPSGSGAVNRSVLRCFGVVEAAIPAETPGYSRRLQENPGDSYGNLNIDICIYPPLLSRLVGHFGLKVLKH